MPDKVFYRVDIIESEAGWGSRIDESIYFTNKAKAVKYVKDYNDKYNTASVVPAWYMAAQEPVTEIFSPEDLKKLRKDIKDRPWRRRFSKE